MPLPIAVVIVYLLAITYVVSYGRKTIVMDVVHTSVQGFYNLF